RSGAVRHGVTMAYCAGWLRPQENFTVAVAQERAAGFDRDLRGLMGWRPGHDGSLGIIYSHPRHLSGPLAHALLTPPAPRADRPRGAASVPSRATPAPAPPPPRLRPSAPRAPPPCSPTSTPSTPAPARSWPA